jgi:hypothetical protein
MVIDKTIAIQAIVSMAGSGAFRLARRRIFVF